MRALETIGATCAVLGILGALGLVVRHASDGDWWPAAAGVAALVVVGALWIGVEFVKIGEDARDY